MPDCSDADPEHQPPAAGESPSTVHADGSASPEIPALGLPVAAVARRLGVAPATLRTWARRYGLGPGTHAAGSHRRYGPDDVARLDAMCRLTREGMAPGDAAKAALSLPVPAPPDPDHRRRGGPGGRVLALPGAGSVARGLGRAAMALDSASVTRTVREQLAQHGVVPTWDHVLRPVLASAGARWARTGEGIEVEHLLSDCITAAFREVAERTPAARAGRSALLASAPEEQHALPLHAVAAGLSERGIASIVLGPAMPAGALLAAVRRTGAPVLFLWSHFSATAEPATRGALPAIHPPTAVVLGGPGWPRQELPARVSVADDLTEALDLVALAAAG